MVMLMDSSGFFPGISIKSAAREEAHGGHSLFILPCPEWPCRRMFFGRGDGKLTCGDLDDPVPRFVPLSGRSGT